MPIPDQSPVGYLMIPSPNFLRELVVDERRDGYVSDQVRLRVALLIRALREQRGWSQVELGRRLGKPQSVISRLEDPDYGKLSLQTLFEVAAVFKLPLYIDMPNWEDWFSLMGDMSSKTMRRQEFDSELLTSIKKQCLDQQHQGPEVIPVGLTEPASVARHHPVVWGLNALILGGNVQASCTDLMWRGYQAIAAQHEAAAVLPPSILPEVFNLNGVQVSMRRPFIDADRPREMKNLFSQEQADIL